MTKQKKNLFSWTDIKTTGSDLALQMTKLFRHIEQKNKIEASTLSKKLLQEHPANPIIHGLYGCSCYCIKNEISSSLQYFQSSFALGLLQEQWMNQNEYFISKILKIYFDALLDVGRISEAMHCCYRTLDLKLEQPDWMDYFIATLKENDFLQEALICQKYIQRQKRQNCEKPKRSIKQQKTKKHQAHRITCPICKMPHDIRTTQKNYTCQKTQKNFTVYMGYIHSISSRLNNKDDRVFHRIRSQNHNQEKIHEWNSHSTYTTGGDQGDFFALVYRKKRVISFHNLTQGNQSYFPAKKDFVLLISGIASALFFLSVLISFPVNFMFSSKKESKPVHIRQVTKRNLPRIVSPPKTDTQGIRLTQHICTLWISKKGRSVRLRPSRLHERFILLKRLRHSTLVQTQTGRKVWIANTCLKKNNK